MAQFEQHLTTEQLSAFLDRDLSDQEQSLVERHLALCTLCQQRLTELRLTVQLLHALPQPELPRSFALPLDTKQAEPLPIATLSPMASTASSASLAASRRSKAAPPPYLRPLRAVSALAATIGIIFLLSALLPFLALPSSNNTVNSGSSTTSSSVPRASSGSDHAFNAGNLTQAAMSPHASTKSPQATQVATAPPPVYQPAQPDVQPVASSPPLIVSLFDLSSTQGRALLGSLLLLLGILGLIFLRRSRKAL